MNNISKRVGLSFVVLMLFAMAYFISSTAYAAANYDFRQCLNDDAAGSKNDGIIDPCEWSNGAINSINSDYAESDGVPQRFLFTHNEPHVTHTATFEYDFTKNDVYGYDFVVDVNHTMPLSLLNPCANLPSFLDTATCQNLYNNATEVVIPDDTFDQVTARQHPYGPGQRHILFGCDHNGTNTCSSVSIISITHVPPTTCFKDCGDSSVQITMQWDAPANEDAYVGMWFAGELASQNDPDGAGGAIGWGTGCGSPSTGCGASSAPGASYHFKLVDIDGSSIGGEDNQINISGLESGHDADLSVTKTCPGDVTAGNNITYTIKVTNSGPDTATSVYMDDTLPPGVTWVSASTSQGTCDTHTVGSSVSVEHCDIDFMQPGDEETITIVVGVPSGTADNTTLTNSATVGGAVLDPTTTNNTQSCDTTVHQPSAPPVAVSVDKTCPVTDVVAGGNTFSYAVTVTNYSTTDTAEHVILTDSLPGGVTFDHSTPGISTCTESGGVVTCDFGSLSPSPGPGNTATVTIYVKANASTIGEITNTATVSLENQQNTSLQSTDSCNTNVVGEVDLTVTKSPCHVTYNAGSQIVYTITVGNKGPSTATGTQVVDTLDTIAPVDVTFVSATSSQGAGCTFNNVDDKVTCDLGTIPPNPVTPPTITVTVLINDDAGGNTIENVATVSSAGTETNSTDNTFTCDNDVQEPEVSVDLSVEKVCPLSPVAGNTFSYQVTVTNGSDTDGAAGVTLTDTLPDGVTFQSGFWPPSGPPSGNCTESGGVVTCNIGNLAADTSVVVTIAVLIDPGTRGSITNTAVVSGNEGDPDTDNNTYQCASDVTGQVDLQITKTDSPDPVITGNNLTYTIHISNPNGPSDATNVQVVDTLPPGAVSFVSASPTQGSCINNGNVSVTCNLGTITPGDSATITIVVRVNNLALNPGACTAITNTATVKSDEDSTGKQATADTRVCAAPIGIPALTDWGMLILIMLAGVVSVIYLRRHRKA